MNTVGTSYRLSWLSGINPYAPLLALAIAARWYGFPINPDVAFLTQDYCMILLPNTQQNTIELVPLNRRPHLVTTSGIVKGSLKITIPYSPQTQYPGPMQPQVQVYEFTVLRPDWSAVETLVRPFQPLQVVSQQWHYPLSS